MIVCCTNSRLDVCENVEGIRCCWRGDNSLVVCYMMVTSFITSRNVVAKSDIFRIISTLFGLFMQFAMYQCRNSLLSD